uniref:acyl-CoA dehydrogenase family protein n=1 Tax=Nocardia farcinica TaxID=37329 RepID=UPI002455DD40
MDFELTEEQRLLREFSRAMLTAACPPALVRAVADAGTDGDDALWQKAVELGWPSLAVAEDAGGAGQGVIELCLVAEEVGRAAAPGPFAESALVAAAAAGGGAPRGRGGGQGGGQHKGARGGPPPPPGRPPAR